MSNIGIKWTRAAVPPPVQMNADLGFASLFAFLGGGSVLKGALKLELVLI